MNNWIQYNVAVVRAVRVHSGWGWRGVGCALSARASRKDFLEKVPPELRLEK